MGIETPKQFLTLANKPVIVHSAQTLGHLDFAGNRILGEMIVIAPSEYQEATRAALGSLECRITSGGETRQESTLSGLAALDGIANGEDIVLIHDAARPLITPQEVKRLCDGLESNPDFDIASLVGPVSETIVSVQPNSAAHLDQPVPRDTLRAVKTPQALRWKIVDRLREFHGDFTDLLSWAHAAGLPGLLVPCDPANIKLTSPADLPLLESLAASGK